jgi:hypothetical protein
VCNVVHPALTVACCLQVFVRQPHLLQSLELQVELELLAQQLPPNQCVREALHGRSHCCNAATHHQCITTRSACHGFRHSVLSTNTHTTCLPHKLGQTMC